ncbi:MAG: hypothetical protein ACJ76J_07930 [Thermoanaerobaculia bacterium]
MRKTLLAVTLAAALAAGRPALLDHVWSFFTSIWSEAGCRMDPSGLCVPAPQVDEGCIMDPNGRCLPAPRTDEGCRMDPSGGCLPAPQADEGCGMDPNGCPG